MAASSKTGIRAEALARRAAVSDAVRDAFASRLATMGASLVRSEQDPFADPVVSLFLPVRGEPDTRPLIDVLAKVGLVTSLPVPIARGEPLVFRRWSPGEPLEQGSWGIEQPPVEAPTVEPDVLFVPLAAFDRRGARIGYGAGYYDATLAALRRKKHVRAIGVAFSCQEVLYVPAEDHDQPLDLVLTERDVILCEI
ncbi:5-formyltetrahydrofolate cyclo-ligase [Lichenifustis flavocetrariae]|uniref:5-formyltetrahydrofolate cyclo-ligase n=1 Tax=Lichenifustis flavocetrariae TaxID=2949735 RepID=A0AA41YXD3_9HYPH|nr:5-formyltetrahydrofolate cyclo-ligase [Lichenifustis flavocetrariae]MCW6506683.1 5-formyltetrahydrofolate cyclo-ligase [Lichenifustis flavocetrariae]